MVKRPQEKIVDTIHEGLTSRIENTDLNTYFIFGAIILVLVVGIYAIFSPEAQAPRSGNPACGKIVIATDGPRLANNVAVSLPEARYFLVVDPLSRKLLEVIRNPYRGQQPNPQIVYLIAGKGEEAVIVGNIDKQSYDMLMQFGIRVFGGYAGQARKSVTLYRQARISQTTPTVDTTVQVPAMDQAPQQMIPVPAQTAPMPGSGVQNMTGNGTGNPYCQIPAMNQAPQQMVPGGAQVAVGQFGCNFVCPRCRLTANGRVGMCPVCPNCQLQMLQQNGASPATGANFGMQGAGMGMGGMNPYCQLPVTQGAGMGMGMGMGGMNPYCQLPVNQVMNTQGQVMQSPTQAAFGMPDANMMGMDVMGNPMAMGNQVAFGWGEQNFVCPNCNWRLRCARQGNSFPSCPNCNSPMALDMAKANKGWNLLPEIQWAAGQQGVAQQAVVQQAANMNQLRPQFNAANNQPNFWQGAESTGFFICPNCNWRMYSQQGLNQFPQCPNCQQIMARSGAYYQQPNQQNNAGLMYAPVNNPAGTRVALQTQTTAVKAPPIFRDAVMPHAYRGVCENCHIVRADIPIAANAQMPHPYRGVCSNCHKILGTAAGAGTTAANAGAQAGPVTAQGQGATRVVLGGGG